MNDLKAQAYAKIKYDGEDELCYIEKFSKNTANIFIFKNGNYVQVPKNNVEPLCEIALNKEEFQKLTRFETSLTEVIGNDNIPSNIINKDEYKVSAEDLLYALENFASKNITRKEFNYDWFSYFYSVFKDAVTENLEENDFYSEWFLVNETIEILSDTIQASDEEVSDYIDVEDLIEDLSDLIEDRNKPLSEKRFCYTARKAVLERFSNSEELKTASSEEVKLYRDIVLEFAEYEEQEGIYALAKNCYGGSRAFDCDWKTAEECLLKLIQEDNSVLPLSILSDCANKLGKICYYGKTTEPPDYNKAFKYFSVASESGSVEAKYLLADMFKEGSAPIKNINLASEIYQTLYAELIKDFSGGFFSNDFADIALRIGDTALELDIDSEENYRLALYYYLQADFAIRMRMKELDLNKDKELYKTIQNALEKAKNQSEYLSVNKICTSSVKELLNVNFNRDEPLEMKIKQLKNGAYKLTFSVHQTDLNSYRPRLFITVPELDTVGMYDKFSVNFYPDDEYVFENVPDFLIFDNYRQGCLLLNEEYILDLSNGVFEIEKPKEKNKVYQLVSVISPEDGFSYEYRDDEKILKVGDKILVNLDGEEKRLKVSKTIERKESELPLPISSYKKVIKKL